MTAKEYLTRIRLLDNHISEKKWELEDIKCRHTLISAVDYSKERTTGSKSGNASFEKISDRIVDLEQEINHEIEKFAVERHKIINLIHELGDCNFSRVLYEHYVKYKSFFIIAEEMNYTYQYVLELHAGALKKFESSYKIPLKF